MSRLWCLLGVALLCLPIEAQANASCQAAIDLHGNVRSVLVSQGRVMADTGEPRNRPHRWERWRIARDRRTVTVIQYSADGGSLLPLFNLWPTTICEFDQGGRLLRTRLKLNGLSTYRTVEIGYDGQGRRTAVKSQSRNPEMTYELSYEYDGNAVTERSPKGGASTTITERDASGRATSETRRRGSDVELSRLDYRYGPDTVEILGGENGKRWRIVKRLDANGNMIEQSTFNPSFETHESFRYEYDPRGNWIRRVTVRRSTVAPPSRGANLEIRQITYW